MKDIGALANRLREDEKTNAIRQIFLTMQRYNVTLEELTKFKESKSCDTGDYAKHRTRAKNRRTYQRLEEAPVNTKVNPFSKA